MNAYPKDLGLKALAAIDRGVPKKEAVGTFGVSSAALKRWLKRRREGEDLSPRPSPGRTRRASSPPPRSGASCGRNSKRTTTRPWSATASCGSKDAAWGSRSRR